MFRWFLRPQIAGFERTWNYDASYLHELIKVDPQAILAFGKLQAISNYRKDVPGPHVRLDVGNNDAMIANSAPTGSLPWRESSQIC
jgi:hypothetical protein